ncbi:MAG: acetyl-CoA carboxylase biotin carboxyl carrier protein subunit, partial [Burkholderiaceae bacterium]
TYTRTLTFQSERGTKEIQLEYGRDGYRFHHEGLSVPLMVARQADRLASGLSIRFGDRTLAADVVRHGEELHIFTAGRHRSLALVDVIAQSSTADTGGGRLTAPMPGKIIAISTTPGAKVERGAPLLVMEAMKMEHTIVAPADGVVADLLYGVGDQVAEGAELVRFTNA